MLFLVKGVWFLIVLFVVAVINGIGVAAFVECENDIPNVRVLILLFCCFADKILDLKATAIVPRLATEIGAFRRKFILVDTVETTAAINGELFQKWIVSIEFYLVFPF